MRSAAFALPADPTPCRILVLDDDTDRLTRIALLVTAACPQARVEVSGAADAAMLGRAHLLLIAAAESEPAAGKALAAVRAARQAGVCVLAYAPRFEGWSVAQKCRPLIAGAARVLDCGSPGFAGSLRAALVGLVQAMASREAEAAHVCARLRALGVEGESPIMTELFRKVLRFGALSDLPVLVTGETGTGKERFTRALHQCDPKRAAGPFVAVNCAALAPNLAESELFGHRRGAFTGAERTREGLVRAAHGGVLFLDEIGELDPVLQAKLLRVLQEGRVLGVGDEHEIEVNVRVVAATNRDLHTMVAEGRFRADLYHRLGVLVLELPPLRGRTADIAGLTTYFIHKYRAIHRAARHPPSRDFVDALCRHPLPGNARQLENVVRAVLVNKADDAPLALSDLTPDFLEELLAEEPPAPAARAAAPGRPDAACTAGDADSLMHIVEANDWNLQRCIRACERAVVAAALHRVSGNQTKAASLLGVTARSVYNKVHKLGVVR